MRVGQGLWKESRAQNVTDNSVGAWEIANQTTLSFNRSEGVARLQPRADMTWKSNEDFWESGFQGTQHPLQE